MSILFLVVVLCVGRRIGELQKYQEFQCKLVYMLIDDPWLPVDAEYIQDHCKAGAVCHDIGTSPNYASGYRCRNWVLLTYPQRVRTSSTRVGCLGAKTLSGTIAHVPLGRGCVLAISFTMPWTPQQILNGL